MRLFVLNYCAMKLIVVRVRVQVLRRHFNLICTRALGSSLLPFCLLCFYLEYRIAFL